VAGAASCEFGAEQAVLVRSEEARARLRARIGDRALVLTAQECKGLEFQVGCLAGRGGGRAAWRRPRLPELLICTLHDDALMG
jgi:hypothetical protein